MRIINYAMAAALITMVLVIGIASLRDHPIPHKSPCTPIPEIHETQGIPNCD